MTRKHRKQNPPAVTAMHYGIGQGFSANKKSRVADYAFNEGCRRLSWSPFSESYKKSKFFMAHNPAKTSIRFTVYESFFELYTIKYTVYV
jgi:ABC-type bacteriocin/lantibiotic exporter with double-glycine peptidase domain